MFVLIYVLTHLEVFFKIGDHKSVFHQPMLRSVSLDYVSVLNIICEKSLHHSASWNSIFSVTDAQNPEHCEKLKTKINHLYILKIISTKSLQMKHTMQKWRIEYEKILWGLYNRADSLNLDQNFFSNSFFHHLDVGQKTPMVHAHILNQGFPNLIQTMKILSYTQKRNHT